MEQVPAQIAREFTNCVFWYGHEIGVEEFYQGVIMLTFREGSA